MKEVLGSRGLNIDPTCELCGGSPESIIHTLRDCKVVKSMWRDLGIEDDNQDFFGLNLEAWLEKNRGNSSMYPRPRTPWKILFPQVVQTRPFFKEQGHRNKVYGVLGIWLHRNKAIFQMKRA